VLNVIKNKILEHNKSVNHTSSFAKTKRAAWSVEKRPALIGQFSRNVSRNSKYDRSFNKKFLAAQLGPKYAEQYGFDKIADYQLHSVQLKIANISLDQMQTKEDIMDWNDVNMDEIGFFDSQIVGNLNRTNHLWHHVRRENVFTKV